MQTWRNYFDAKRCIASAGLSFLPREKGWVALRPGGRGLGPAVGLELGAKGPRFGVTAGGQCLSQQT